MLRVLKGGGVWVEGRLLYMSQNSGARRMRILELIRSPPPSPASPC